MSSMTASPARERIESLLDPGSFVEIGAAITARNTDFTLSEKKKPSDGVITGYGLIAGRLVYLFSQDVSVLKGTLGEMHAEKIVRIFDMAVKMGAPVIGLIDSAGMRLEEGTDALDAFGKIYMAMSKASGIVPEIIGVFGNCGGGMALLPAMADFCYMEADHGRVFVNAPNAIPATSSDSCDFASSLYNARQSGLADGTGSAEELFTDIRNLITLLPGNLEDEASDEVLNDDLNRLIPNAAALMNDPAILLAHLADNRIFCEIKKEFGTDIVAGLIKLGGSTVGVIANRKQRMDAEGNVEEDFDGALSARGAKKAARFVRFCDAFSLPVITLTNVRKFHASICSEANMAREVSVLTDAFASATTAKINVITGEAFGTAGMIMNSHALGADLVYAWEGAKVGMMDAEMAAKIMYEGESPEVLREKQQAYESLQNNLDMAAARGYVDTIIHPDETRKYLIGAVEMLFTKRESRPLKKRGTI